ncbi:unnamed protein product [Arabis nemorensis]|uniref:Uncharacterized protein n=1 Tax=Arabis nemorensis TaxID=586526 RepID=A0A565AWM3_9BRAS|nr:unnamed protein product [Arabis nemorensis]
MGRLVCLLRGIWIMTPYGRWEFRSDPSDLGYGANLHNDESFESLLGNVKRRYLLETASPVALTYRLPELLPDPYINSGPPSDILSDEDVFVFMSIRFCYPELTLCVTVGAKAVATY